MYQSPLTPEKVLVLSKKEENPVNKLVQALNAALVSHKRKGHTQLILGCESARTWIGPNEDAAIIGPSYEADAIQWAILEFKNVGWCVVRKGSFESSSECVQYVFSLA